MTADERWLYGPEVALMRAFPGRSIGELLAEPGSRRYFLDNGAVELAAENISRWKHRLREALRYHYMFVGEGEIASSSAYDYRHLFSMHTRADGTVEDVVLHIGELVGWIFITEENGPRRRHVFYPGEVEGHDNMQASAAGGMG
jgi:hypothetical protein